MKKNKRSCKDDSRSSNQVTSLDVMAQILSEVVPGLDKKECMDQLKMLGIKSKPMTKTEAESTLAGLRKEKAGIFNWLLQGARRAHKKIEFYEDMVKKAPYN